MAKLRAFDDAQLEWLLYAAYVAQVRQLRGMLGYRLPERISRNSGLVKPPKDQVAEIKPKPSSWNVALRRLKRARMDVPLYVPNLFAVIISGAVRPGTSIPFPKDLASDYYMAAVAADARTRPDLLKISFESSLAQYKALSARQRMLMPGSRAEDVIIDTLLSELNTSSSVFKYCMAYSFGNEIMRHHARKQFGVQASLELFSYWHAYEVAWANIIPSELWAGAEDIYLQFLKEACRDYEDQDDGG